MPSIDSLREEIEAVDVRIIAMIAERVRLAKAVGCEKAAAGYPVIDPALFQAELDASWKVTEPMAK